ncbi:tetratricopeptide repeat protein [Photobacterium kasasachensis]|uniref:tetratricopeptide repeat protein n=1 Tax=Photobacterium kasasachensis TaxID=2910240 RepID=UPI003D148B4F
MDVPGAVGMALNMSEINKKLNALNQQKKPSSVAAQPLQAAVVKPVPKNHGPKWAVLSVCAALIAGGAGWWLGANSQADSQSSANVDAVPVPSNLVPSEHAPLLPEPQRQHVTSDAEQEAKQAVVPPPVTISSVKKSGATPVSPLVSSAKPVKNAEKQPVPETKTAPKGVREEKARIKKVAIQTPEPVDKPSTGQVTNPRQALKPQQDAIRVIERESSATRPVEVDDETSAEGLMIETVELDAGQLANVEYKKAQKALKAGDSRKAIGFLKQTLKYQPEWIRARQKLAALYYGRGDTRKAIATLQDGLVLDGDQPDLRLTMAKLLVNESQQQAALNVLSRMPKKNHSGYLAMRGALAQQLNNNELAMSSYQLLVTEEPYDGRWWLGLGIALERSKEAEKALDAYKQALLMGRISSQSQQFIQQRLALLEAREG